MTSVAMGKEGEGGVMEAVMGKARGERLRDRICRKITPICNCLSVAARQAREAEIEVPSKRRIRELLASEEASFALPQDEGTGVREVIARTRIGARSFLHCLDDVTNQAAQLKTGGLERREYRKLPE